MQISPWLVREDPYATATDAQKINTDSGKGGEVIWQFKARLNWIVKFLDGRIISSLTFSHRQGKLPSRDQV